MKTLLFITTFTIGLTIAVFGQDQDKYYTKNGHIEFFSTTPVEDILATNDQVAALINTKTGEVSFVVLMRSFQFEKALMQEHFNEKFVESHKYPKSTFEGKILNWKPEELTKDKELKVEVQGDLTLHGVTRSITESGTIKLLPGNKIHATSEFIAKPEDYDIKIPSVVRDNIAKEIEVTVDVELEPYN
ncbi:MAG: YceI family protein [Bacteroidetes bacterium]|jgi:hypothetical protein|nr:YceI family protein [Bacteroidota bacterium]